MNTIVLKNKTKKAEMTPPLGWEEELEQYDQLFRTTNDRSWENSSFWSHIPSREEEKIARMRSLKSLQDLSRWKICRSLQTPKAVSVQRLPIPRHEMRRVVRLIFYTDVWSGESKSPSAVRRKHLTPSQTYDGTMPQRNHSHTSVLEYVKNAVFMFLLFVLMLLLRILSGVQALGKM